MTIRERQERDEEARLSPYAALSSRSVGRAHPISTCDLRTCYQRDRDRIIHCKSFRRLKYKTQVFLTPMGDHYRTRLTHTLEVSQVARTLARSLRLNEDLTEAAALGHDLGHTPFGHIGESTLNRLLPGGFRHNEQSLRVAERLENDGQGLNLCRETLDGILNHSGQNEPKTLEGWCVRRADRIAYINHDIDDAIRAGILREVDLPASTHAMLGPDHSSRIETLVLDMVETSAAVDDIRMSDAVWNAMMELRSFLFERVYSAPAVTDEVAKATHLVDDLFDYYVAHTGEVPQEYRAISEGDDLRAVTDFIAGMTDRYAKNLYQRLFIPNALHY